MITFEYDGKIYKPSNLEKKLKKLGITINDVKIIDDTQTNAEKEREERKSQNFSTSNEYKVDVYWDNKCKGWYIVDRHFPLSPEWGMRFFQEIENGRYKLVKHDVNKSNLLDFFNENFKRVINN